MNRRFSGVDRRLDDMNRRFDEISRKLDKVPTEWGMAKVVFFVVGALIAAAIWMPRVLSMLGNPSN